MPFYGISENGANIQLDQYGYSVSFRCGRTNGRIQNNETDWLKVESRKSKVESRKSKVEDQKLGS